MRNLLNSKGGVVVGLIVLVAVIATTFSVLRTPANEAAAETLLSRLPEPVASNQQLEQTFVGKVDGTNYFISVVLGGDKVAAGYLCDNNQDSWLKGSLSGSDISLKGEGSTVVAATFANNQITGTVTIDGAPLAFVATAVKADEGLYRSNSEYGLGGWIRHDGETRGLFKRFRNSPPPPPPPPPTSPSDPCADPFSASCSAAICASLSRDFLSADTKSERDAAVNSATVNNCTLDPFAVVEQP